MAASEIAVDVEPKSNTAPSSQPQSRMDETVSKDANEPTSWRQRLLKALRQRKWDAIKQILDTVPEAINSPVGEDEDTALVVAIREGLGMPIINKLVDRMSPEDLAKCGRYSLPALVVAAFCGDLSVVKLLIAKNPELPNTGGQSFYPILAAAGRGLREMAFYLHSLTSESLIEDDQLLIEHAVNSGLYDFSLHLLQRHPKFAEHSAHLLTGVVGNPHAFRSGTPLNMFQSIIYSCIRMNSTIVYKSLEHEAVVKPAIHSQPQAQRHSTISRVFQELQKVPSKVLQIFVGPIKNIGDLKLKHCQAFELVRSLCMEINKSGGEESHTLVYDQFVSAAQNGITEVVELMLQVFPRLRSYMSNDIDYTLHLVLPYRDEKIFNIIHQQIPQFERPLHYVQDGGGTQNILHLVAYKPRQNRLDVGSRVVLQMQRELQWFKGVEKLLSPHLRNKRNGKGKTPFEIFEEEHRDMAASEGEWIISMANSCIVGGSLIATVVFAAAITVPGGNEDDGLPIFSKQVAFKVFAWSDTFALVSSLTAVVIFLSIFTTRYSINDFLYHLPHKLIIGLISLLLSVTFMMVAFSAIVYLVFAEDNNWIIFPIAVVAFVPVYFFLKLQLRSLLDMMRSTYCHNIFKPVENTHLSLPKSELI